MVQGVQRPGTGGSNITNRCVLYVRVSSADQNPALQHDELTAYATSRGWHIVKVYEDRMTGTHANRRGLQELLNDARQRKFDILLCWKLDRVFRSTRDCINYLQDFSELGIQFVSLKDTGIDMTLPSGRLLLHLLAAFAEFEASIIKMRVKAGLDAARSRGVKLGRPEVVTADLIREVVSLRKSGLSIRSIERALNKKISKTSIERVLKENGCTKNLGAKK